MKIKKYFVIDAETMELIKICDSKRGARQSLSPNGTARFHKNRTSAVEGWLMFNPRDIVALDPKNDENESFIKSVEYKDQITDKKDIPPDLLIKYDLMGW